MYTYINKSCIENNGPTPVHEQQNHPAIPLQH
jgi:hypothetical protein